MGPRLWEPTVSLTTIEDKHYFHRGRPSFVCPVGSRTKKFVQIVVINIMISYNFDYKPFLKLPK